MTPRSGGAPGLIAELLVRSRAMRRFGAAVITMAAVASAALPAVAAAAATPIENGFYSGLVGVKSADVEFHVRGGDKIPGLTLTCIPKDQSLLGAIPTSSITIKAPALTIHGGQISFHGASIVTPAGSPKKTGTTTLAIQAHHVPGPVRHYTFEGRHLQQTTAWKGTVSSPACKTVPAGGTLTLFGPIAGE
jgi:hypothetical protein